MTQGALTVEQFLREYTLSRATFYRCVRDGEIQIRKCGSRTLILREEAERWAHSLPVAREPVTA